MLSTIGYLSPWLVLGVVLFMGWLPMVLKIGSIGVIISFLVFSLLNKNSLDKDRFFILLGVIVVMGIFMYFLSDYLIIQIFVVGLYIWKYFNLTKAMKYYEHNGYVNMGVLILKDILINTSIFIVLYFVFHYFNLV